MVDWNKDSDRTTRAKITSPKLLILVRKYCPNRLNGVPQSLSSNNPRSASADVVIISVNLLVTLSYRMFLLLLLGSLKQDAVPQRFALLLY